MSLIIYYNILENIVAFQFVKRSLDSFILKEDGDSGYSEGNSTKYNIVKKWKENYYFKYFFNTSNSPNLSPIENYQRTIKQYIYIYYKFSIDLKELILKSWEQISQEIINS